MLTFGPTSVFIIVTVAVVISMDPRARPLAQQIQCPTAEKPMRTLCLLPHAEIISASTHAAHTVQFYREQYPCLNWTYKFLTTNDNTAKNFVRTWAIESTNCSFLVGPGFSYLAVALSPLVDIPWFDPTATSTELSNKERNPSFSRVIPTDEVGAQAAFVTMKRFGWKDTNIFTADESYGRSVSQSVANQIREAGGTIGESFAVDPDYNGVLDQNKTIRDAVAKLLASNIRVVFIAALPFQQMWLYLRDEIIRTKAYEQLIFFFSEAMCSLQDRAYMAIPGAFCATYQSEPSVFNPFFVSYQARSTAAQDLQALRALGFSQTSAADVANASDLYAVLAHDAALHGMHTLHESWVNVTSRQLDEDPIDVGRRITTSENAASGDIKLEANGDRSIIGGTLWHALPASVSSSSPEGEIRVAKLQIPGNTFDVIFFQKIDDGTEEADLSAPRPDLFLFGRVVSGSEEIPAGTIKAESDSGNVTLMIATIIGASAILALSSIFMSAILRPKQSARDSSFAPTDENLPFTIVFTDIQSSTSLWAREPQTMSEAVALHHETIRRLIKKHRGYEVKTLGDSFMVAFQSPRGAASFAIDVQNVLLKLDWQDDNLLEETYQELFVEEGMDIPPQSEILWSGLRIRIGLHEGLGQIKYDEMTNGYDYFGTVVNTAARLEAVGHGGQIIVTHETLRGICEDCDGDPTSRWATPMPVSGASSGGAVELKHFFVFPLGNHLLRGLDTSSTLYQLSPKGTLLNRKWPPLRLDAPSIVTAFEHDDPFTPVPSVASSEVQEFTIEADDLNLLLYKHCKKRLMRWHEGWEMAKIEAYADRLMETQLILKTILSVGKDKFKRSTVATLAQKWRLVYHVTETRLLAPRTYETALMDLAIKVQNVVDNQCDRERRKIIAALSGSSVVDHNSGPVITTVGPGIRDGKRNSVLDVSRLGPEAQWVTRRENLRSAGSLRHSAGSPLLNPSLSSHGSRKYLHNEVSCQSLGSTPGAGSSGHLEPQYLNETALQNIAALAGVSAPGGINSSVQTVNEQQQAVQKSTGFNSFNSLHQ